MISCIVNRPRVQAVVARSTWKGDVEVDKVEPEVLVTVEVAVALCNFFGEK